MRMPIAIALVLLGAFSFCAAPAEARAAKAQASVLTKIEAAKENAMKARHSLRWITTHMHNYKNAKAYHRVIVKHRGRLFHWRDQLAKLRAQWAHRHPPHMREWLCIHKYEGPWNDTGSPYYGGLQMDWGFMRAYGGWLLAKKGTADRWTPLEQMWVAERALRAGRGFYPWPNTARMCGLI